MLKVFISNTAVFRLMHITVSTAMHHTGLLVMLMNHVEAGDCSVQYVLCTVRPERRLVCAEGIGFMSNKGRDKDVRTGLRNSRSGCQC